MEKCRQIFEKHRESGGEFKRERGKGVGEGEGGSGSSPEVRMEGVGGGKKEGVRREESG